MGEDKSLLPFSSSKTLAQYQYDRLKPYFENVYISSKTNKFDFLNEKNLILDEKKISSPLIALRSIMKQIDDKFFIITVDCPFVSIETISKLIESSKNYEICIAKTTRTQNLCGVYSSSLQETCDGMIKKNIHKVSDMFFEKSIKILQFEKDYEFININNKEEYKKALSLIDF